jgi:hypothetical protein
MDHGNRNILVFELPLVKNIFDAATVFGWADLSAKEIVHYGSIPALIYMAYLNKTKNKLDYLPFSRRKAAITLCETTGLVTSDSVVNLLSSFITGYEFCVPLPLHQLMDTTSHQKLRWIPFHMIEVLRSFSSLLNPKLKNNVDIIVSLFNSVVDDESHLSDETSWKSLFLIVLIIRLATRQFDSLFLPFGGNNGLFILLQ